MELDDVVAQRVGANLLVVAAKLAPAVVFIGAPVGANVIGRRVIVDHHILGALNCLLTLFGCEVQIVLSHQIDGTYT